MDTTQNEKVTMLLPPQLADNADFANNTYMDIAGAGKAHVELHVGALDAAIGSTDESTPPVLEECDAVDGTYTEISGAVLSAVIGATDDNKIYRIDVPMKSARKRYVRVKAPHAGDGTNGANLMILGRVSNLDTGPKTAAERGYAEHVIV